MTSLTDTQVITASGGLVELGYAERTSTYTIPSTSSSFADPLCGTVTIVTDGSPLLVEFQSPASSVATGGSIYVNLVVNGSVTGIIYQSIDGAGAQNVGIRASRRLTLSAGTHTINVSAWGSGSPSPTIQAGNGGVGSFHPMFLRVSKIVQATQWPAVTTGTIICTSSTRPASPFEGQKIYETDTKKEMTYDGAGWYAFNQVIGYASSTSSFSTSATHTTLQDNGLTTGSIPYADNRRIRVTLYARPYPNGGLQRMEFRVLAGSDTAGYWALGTTGLSASEAPYKCMTNVWTTTSSGSAVFKAQVKASVSNTQVTDYYSVSDGLARSLTIEDIGPA